MNHLSIIIPALNEAGNIYSLVQDIRETLAIQVIVVDNGSTDATATEARLAGAVVVSEPRRGYGYACNAGVTAARGAEILAFIDEDGII